MIFMFGVFIEMDLTIDVILGDILKEDVDVIVNPANPFLHHGGGLSGIIHEAVLATGEQNYKQFLREIKAIPADEDKIRCPFGQAVITSAPGLKFKAIIHTVGANATIHKTEKEQARIILACYYNSMVLANTNEFESIAFPLISAGIYAVPKNLVAYCIKKACNKFIKNFPEERFLNHIKIIVIEEADLSLF